MKQLERDPIKLFTKERKLNTLKEDELNLSTSQQIALEPKIVGSPINGIDRSEKLLYMQTNPF